QRHGHPPLSAGRHRSGLRPVRQSAVRCAQDCDYAVSARQPPVAGSQRIRLLEMVEATPPPVTAVIHPSDALSLTGSVEGARRGLIEPVLIGPRARIVGAARAAGLAIDAYRLSDVEHSHAAAARGCEMAAEGEAAAIMKGALHTDELLEAAVSGP